jgi:hypothetical protein
MLAAAYEPDDFDSPDWDTLDDEDEISWKGQSHSMPLLFPL